MYKHMNLMDCVAEDAADYARIALGLGTDPEWAAEVGAKIAEGSDRIFDDPVFLDAADEFLMTVEPPAQ